MTGVDALPMVGAGLIIALFVLGLTHAGVRTWVLAHAWLTRLTGALVGVGGLLSPFVIAPALDGSGATGAAWINGAVLLSITGFTLVLLPHSIGQFVRNQDATRQAAPALKTMSPGGISGWRDGLAALRAPFENGAATLRILSPWVVLTAAVWIAIAARPTDWIKTQPPWLSALMVVAGLLVPILAVPTVAVAWHRFMAAAILPRTGIALPDRAALGYHRRLWLTLMALAFVAGAPASQAPEIARYLNITNIGAIRAIAVVLAATGGLVGLALASQFALVLPAVAMRDDRVTSATSVMATRKLFPSFVIGLAMAIGPFLIPLLMLPAAIKHWTGPGLSLGLVAVVGGAVTLFLLMVVSAAGYLSRVHQRVFGPIPA
jgi:hypothetical protein